jgi:hypothetical protein
MGDGCGGAVRAAASAGDLMLDPAIQLAPAVRTISARTRKMVEMRFLFMINPL